MTKPETILIVDDTEANIDILVGLLKHYDILVALDGETALSIVAEEQVDLILLDIIMPEMDGFEVCQRLKSNADTADVPVIFLTAKTDEESIELAYDTGGIDYVTKPFKPKELLARVKNQLKIKQLISHLEQLSSYDQMTGIYNRRKFFECAEALFLQEGPHVCGMMMDIDKFKDINDSFGHPVGDKVIKQVAQCISNSLPDHAVLGRIGGEEFAVFMNFPWQQACDLLEDIRVAVSQISIDTDQGQTIQFTLSGGLARVNSHHTSVEQVLQIADEALYEAKGAGRNKSIFRS